MRWTFSRKFGAETAHKMGVHETRHAVRFIMHLRQLACCLRKYYISKTYSVARDSELVLYIGLARIHSSKN